ncbi:MAG TPA: LolA-related protein [Steroidobacteraceae bacterium]
MRSRAWQSGVLTLAVLAAWLAGPAGSAGAATDTPAFDRLMALLAQRRHAVADFEETQYLAVLDRPTHSSGVLRYDAPDHLEQRTFNPRPQSMVLDHGVLTMQRGSHRRTLRLQDYPQFAPLIDSVRATLAGDRAALEQRFDADFEGDLEHWELRLRPREPALAALVQSIRLAGERGQILQVEVRQRDGDHSLMRITPRE